MNAGFDHFPESIWEAYALGRLAEEASQPLEEHLLICPACQDLLAAANEYAEVVKAALARKRRRLSKGVSAAVALAVTLLSLHLT